MQSFPKRVVLSVLVSSVILASSLGGVAQAAAGDPSQWGLEAAGDPSQWGLEKKGSFDITIDRRVNEYEGQH